MKLLISLFVLCFAVVSSGIANSDSSIPDMLEKALKGVVIVTIPKNQDDLTHRPMGFATSEKKESVTPYSFRAIGFSASGFVVEINGKMYVITNAHVAQQLNINEPGKIIVQSNNGTKYRMTFKGGDSFYDLAILSFDDSPGTEIIPIEFRGQSKTVRVGEQVFSIGHPLLDQGNFQYTVTDGIVSGLNRRFSGITNKFGYIQHTATISNGNSGGPLLDSDGKIIAINTQSWVKFSFTEDIPYSQMNFALSYNYIEKVFNNIIEYGRVNRAFLGLELRNSLFNEDEEKTGVIISGIIPNSPAYNKIKSGCILKKIGNIEVYSIDDVLEEMEQIEPNTKLSLTLSYEGSIKIVEIESVDLSNKNLELLAEYIFDAYTNYTPTMEKETVYLDKKINSKKTSFTKSLEKDRRTILLGGSGKDASRQWDIQSLSDLGKILRLTLQAGSITLFFENDNEEEEYTTESSYYDYEEFQFPSSKRPAGILIY